MTGLVIIAIFTATATSSINISVDGWAVVRGKKVLRGCLHNFPKYRSPISIYEGFTLFFGLLVCSLCFVCFFFLNMRHENFEAEISEIQKKATTAYPRLRFFSKQIFTR